MVVGKTSTGFDYEYDERILSDWRFVEGVAKTTSDNQIERMQGMVSIVNLLLGDETALIKHLQELNDGFVPSEKMMEEITDIMNGSGTTAKKS